MLAVSLVILAAYVSIGRQFMPAVSLYTEYFEDQIFAQTGVSASIESISGSFQRFNPIVEVNGLALMMNNNPSDMGVPEEALRLASGTAILDVPQTIWQRQLVVEDFLIDGVAIDIAQNESGAWQLRGLDFGGGGGTTNPQSVYSTLRRFEHLSLSNVAINLISADGDKFSLVNGTATIQNLDLSHHIHITANPKFSSQLISISLELEGNNIANVDGQLHIDIPNSNYSSFFGGIDIGDVEVAEFIGGADLWLSIEQGEIAQLTAELSLPRVTMSVAEAPEFTLQGITTKALITRRADTQAWAGALSDASLSWQDLDWRDFNFTVEYQPQQQLQVRADDIDLSLLAQAAADSGFLSAAAAQQVSAYAPRGRLQNLSLTAPLGDNDEALQLRANIVEASVASVNDSVSVAGVNGFLDLSYDGTTQIASGVVEINSDNFSINIPAVFTSTWLYSYANGGIDFEVDVSDGTSVKLASSTIVATSDAVDGRAKFTSFTHSSAGGARSGEFELLVAAERVDATQASLYLPDAPNIPVGLRDTMTWLRGAIIDGDVYDSGVIYRGSTGDETAPATKTFQSYYFLSNGEIEFSNEWPRLQELEGFVYTDDARVDVDVSAGQSMQMQLSDVVAKVRENEAQENWLTIQGSALGETNRGLAYLQAAPLSEGLKQTMANWQSQGGFSADIMVEIPFGQPESTTDVRLNVLLAENQLSLPDYDLDVSAISGPLIFDTRTGLEAEDLSATLFGREVSVDISSQLSNGILGLIQIDALGSADPLRLREWPQHSSFVRDLLGGMSGDMNYLATLSLPQVVDASGLASLRVTSQLLGTEVSLPQPFAKASDQAMPLLLDVEFVDDRQNIRGSLGSELNFDLDVAQGSLNRGVVVMGEADENLEQLLESEVDGVVITGNVSRLVLEQWTEFLSRLTTDPRATQSIDNIIAFVDVNAEIFELYGEELPDVDIRIDPTPSRRQWDVGLISDSVLGQVRIPFDLDSYIELDMDYLRLPGEEEPQALLEDGLSTPVEIAAEDDVLLTTQNAAEIEIVEAIDVLADIDPREFPRLQFATKDFSIGSSSFGSWRFKLDPIAEGADISDLVFDFRGLRLGLDNVLPDDEVLLTDSDVAATSAADQAQAGAGVTPGFRWLFDGETHRSELRGVLYADDLADVLRANGYAESLESSSAVFDADVSWSGSPAFFAAANLSGRLDLAIEDGRFLQGSNSTGALKLISILNLNAILTRLRLSNDLVRSGLAYDEIEGQFLLDDGVVNIQDQLVISGPSSLYQITGLLDLKQETIAGEMYITLPVSRNLPWIGLLTANIPLAVGAFLFDRIFGDQVASLSSAVYTLEGPWEGLEPEFKQAFGSPPSSEPSTAVPVQ